MNRGTASIVVAAQSGALTHMTTISLTVQKPQSFSVVDRRNGRSIEKIERRLIEEERSRSMASPFFLRVTETKPAPEDFHRLYNLMVTSKG
jgi:hypothetical protein